MYYSFILRRATKGQQPSDSHSLLLLPKNFLFPNQPCSHLSIPTWLHSMRCMTGGIATSKIYQRGCGLTRGYLKIPICPGMATHYPQFLSVSFKVIFYFGWYWTPIIDAFYNALTIYLREVCTTSAFPEDMVENDGCRRPQLPLKSIRRGHSSVVISGT